MATENLRDLVGPLTSAINALNEFIDDYEHRIIETYPNADRNVPERVDSTIPTIDNETLSKKEYELLNTYDTMIGKIVSNSTLMKDLRMRIDVVRQTGKERPLKFLQPTNGGIPAVIAPTDTKYVKNRTTYVEPHSVIYERIKRSCEQMKLTLNVQVSTWNRSQAPDRTDEDIEATDEETDIQTDEESTADNAEASFVDTCL